MPLRGPSIVASGTGGHRSVGIRLSGEVGPRRARSILRLSAWATSAGLRPAIARSRGGVPLFVGTVVVALELPKQSRGWGAHRGRRRSRLRWMVDEHWSPVAPRRSATKTAQHVVRAAVLLVGSTSGSPAGAG